uniref:EF-hand domain-containing protein n=1 Tax=Prymnesium polylepis TaxID=72548 RepID=A0A6T8D3R3_9EUKA
MEVETHEFVFAATYVHGENIGVDLHVYGRPVNPSSPTKECRDKVDAKRDQSIANKRLDRFFSTGATYSWSNPSKEQRHKVAEAMRQEAAKSKERATRVGRAQAKSFGRKMHTPLSARPPLNEWSRQEVADILEIFFEFDEDGSGFIDEQELQKLCDVMMVDFNMAEADKFCKDGQVDVKEFFAFYTDCTREEADHAFTMHGWGNVGEY